MEGGGGGWGVGLEGTKGKKMKACPYCIGNYDRFLKVLNSKVVPDTVSFHHHELYLLGTCLQSLWNWSGPWPSQP